jgi:hypothetical protein
LGHLTADLAMLAVNGESFAANFPQFGQRSHEVAAENSLQF